MMMDGTPTYEELQKRVATLEKESSQRQEEQAVLHRRAERYRSIYDTAPLAFVLWDRKYRITGWNKRAEEMFGWTQEEVLGKNFFDFMIPETARPDVQKIANALLKGRIKRKVVNENLTKDGQVILCSWNNSVQRNEQGHIVGSLSLGLDITEMKKAQDVLAAKEKELETKTAHLERINTGLHVLIEHRKEEIKQLEQHVINNVQTLVMPALEKLEKTLQEGQSRAFLNIVKANLKKIVSPYVSTLSSKYTSLTPTEIQVADFIRHGKTSKEISELLVVTPNAISVHRYNIRRKLGLLRKKTNLQSYLQSLAN